MNVRHDMPAGLLRQLAWLDSLRQRDRRALTFLGLWNLGSLACLLWALLDDPWVPGILAALPLNALNVCLWFKSKREWAASRQMMEESILKRWAAYLPPPGGNTDAP